MTPSTRLAQLIKWRDEYKVRCQRFGPVGASGEAWAKWMDWTGARRAQYAAAIKQATIEKRFNQRSKANERKRDHTS